MDFFAGFAWAIPAAFADPLEKCRFERGDVFYDDPKASTADWEAARRAARRIVQVRLPQQGDTAKQDKDAASVFADNWRRSAEIDLIETKDLSTRTIATTQGRLYTYLWRDEESLLDLGTPEPPLPMMAGDLRSRLEKAAANVADQVEADGPASLFVFAFDHASTRLREKNLDIRAALAGVTGCKEMVFPVEPDKGRDPLPTLCWKAYLLPGLDGDVITDLLKPALYNPQSDREGKADRFSISRHGHIVPLEG